MSTPTRPVSGHEHSLINSPTIASQLPYRFPRTGFVLTEVTLRCLDCDQVFAAEDLTGKMTHLLDSVAVIDMVGFCPSCHLYTPGLIRVREDKTFETNEPDGRWHTYRFQYVNLLTRIKVFVCRRWHAFVN